MIAISGEKMFLSLYFSSLFACNEEKQSDYSMYCESNPFRYLISLDADCDQVHMNIDCNDNDASITHTTENDADCDTIPTNIDCDDGDASITYTNESDLDCDQVQVHIDCDDGDTSITYTNENDVDCDQVHMDVDCDDNDASIIYTNENDADCDQVHMNIDCNDNDASITHTTENDADCDTIPTNVDCDDTNPMINYNIENDADCDGFIFEEDCDDLDAELTDCSVCDDNFSYWDSYHLLTKNNYAWRWGYSSSGEMQTNWSQTHLDGFGMARFDYDYNLLGNIEAKLFQHDKDEDGIFEVSLQCVYIEGIETCDAELLYDNILYGFDGDVFYIEEQEDAFSDKRHFTFDNLGRLISNKQFCLDYWTETYFITCLQHDYGYNDDGQRFSTYYTLDGDEYTGEYVRKTYYADGTLQEHIDAWSEPHGSPNSIFGNSWDRSVYRYDEDGILTEESYEGFNDYGGNGYREWESLKLYSNGVLISLNFSQMEENYSSNIEAEEEIIQTFNEQGEETYYEESSFSYNSDEMTSILRTYDAHANPLLQSSSISNYNYTTNISTSSSDQVTWTYSYTATDQIETKIEERRDREVYCDHNIPDSPCIITDIEEGYFYSYTYDDNNNLILSLLEIDSDFDGNYEQIDTIIWSNLYDNNNNILSIRKEEDVASDGTLDEVEETTWVYSTTNQLLSNQHYLDENNDGTYESSFSYEWEFDAFGNSTRYHKQIDDDGDGNYEINSEEITSYLYDTSGNILSQTTTKDINMDGIIDEEVLYQWTYDTMGHRDSQFYQTGTIEEYEKWLNNEENSIPLQYYYEQNGVREIDFMSYCVE